MHYEYIYWALVAFIAVPCAPFSRIAGLVVAQRLLTQLAWSLGAPEPATQVAVFLCAFMLSMSCSTTRARAFASFLFLEMAIAAGYQEVQPVVGWWMVLGLACLQVAFIPFCTDWRAARRALRSFPIIVTGRDAHRLLPA